MNEKDAKLMNPLTLAYVGDSVHDLYVRSRIVQSGKHVNTLHKEAVRHVRCEAQAGALERIEPLLTDEESALVKRARNAHAKHGAPKAATLEAYAKSTALEALLGYLYLTGQSERLEYILDIVTDLSPSKI